MVEVQITRDAIIVIGEVEKNSYGDLLFTDKEGNSYKVSSKRVQYFEKIIIPGTAVQLNYAVAYNREYIYSAVQINLSETGETPPTVQKPPAETPAKGVTRFIAPEEKGMWWKEVGENFRSGLFNKDDKANGSLLWRAYILQMTTSLGLEFTKEKGG